jgi:hypothetical protein
MSDDAEVVHAPLTQAEMAALGGRIGGRSKSKKKAKAARRNGKLGGWHAQKRNQPKVQP